MATRVHGAVEFAFAPLLTTLATNTTLGTSTRHDFTGLSVYIPETLVGGTPFRSVHVVVTVRTQFPGTIRSLTGWRIGIQLGAVAFDDVDWTPNTIVNSGEQYCIRLIRDVTDYFNTNWTGTSMAAAVGVAFATNIADVVGNVTAKIVVGAYDYDDTSGTFIQTVRIPIQSDTAVLSTTKTEVGVSGTGGAPTGQIPALDTFLPEDSVVIRRSWIEVLSNDQCVATTDFNLFVEIDSAGESTRGTIEGTAVSPTWFEDHFIYDTGVYSTATTHTFNARSSLASRFNSLGAVMHVTYEFDPASATHLQSLVLPFESEGVIHLDTDLARALELWVEEPGSVALQQSGVVLWVGNEDLARNVSISGDGGSTFRTYVYATNNWMGPGAIVHRTDMVWSLSRGRNSLVLKYNAAAQAEMSFYGGYYIINYTSGLSVRGKGAHNRSSAWMVAAPVTSGSVNATRAVLGSAQRTPGGLASHYFLNGYGHQRLSLWGQASIPQGVRTWYEVLSGELAGDGYISNQVNPLSTVEYSNHDVVWDLLPYFNVTDQSTGKMDVEAAREWRAGDSYAEYKGGVNWLTHHELVFEVDDVVTGYSGDGSGITVQVWSETRGVVVGSAVTVAGGGFTALVYDDVDTYFAEARQDATRVGRSDNVTPVEA